MNYQSEFTQLENRLNSLNSELSSLSGKCSLLTEQINNGENKLKELSHQREIYKKSIELLNIVQATTKEKTKNAFEAIITHAFHYIYNGDYEFKFEFGKRGNLQELDFNISTPDCKTPYDPKETSGGGILDILSLALRIALLELIQPKIEGFLVLDEPFKHLSINYLEQAGKFLKAINKRIGRQIIMVTHKEEMINNADNVIEIKGELNNE